MFSSYGGIARRIARFSSSNGMHELIHWSAFGDTFGGALHGGIACVMNDGMKNIILLNIPYSILSFLSRFLSFFLLLNFSQLLYSPKSNCFNLPALPTVNHMPMFPQFSRKSNSKSKSLQPACPTIVWQCYPSSLESQKLQKPPRSHKVPTSHLFFSTVPNDTF